MADQTLSDVKVLDLTWHIAGPYCTKMLADYGAAVIKVERPGEGDPARLMGPFLGDDKHIEKSLLFSHLNLNKKSITLDLKSPDGRDAVMELAKDADILVESFSPGVMTRLGLDYETIKQINPGIIYTSISNFGQSGPYKDFKSSELILTGMGTEMYTHGLPGSYPLKLGGNCQQYQVGHMAAAATIAAYWFRINNGVGQHIDVSAQQVLATDTDSRTVNGMAWAYSGTTFLFKQDMRSGVSDISPTGVYPCKDGFVRVTGGVMFWDRFVKLFPELGEKYEFPLDVLNLDYKPEVDAMWYAWCSERTKMEITDACQEVNFFGMAINTPMDSVNSPQFKERGFWVEVDHPVTGKQLYPGNPCKMTSSPWEVRMPAPLLGQHNEDILGSLKKIANMSHVSVSEIEQKQNTVLEKNRLPLEGIRVVDMAVIWAGPYAAWLLGCLGAEVIHVDTPHHRPDWSRGFMLWPTQGMLDQPGGRQAYADGKPGVEPWNRHSQYNRNLWNRLSCCIDLDKPEGKEAFKRLIKESDIFLENNSANAMHHLGLGYDKLLEINPRLICINMPAWGQNGPYKDYVGIGAMHQAMAGEEWIRGYPDDEHPTHNTYRFPMDSTTGPMAVFAAIMGLIQRNKTGKGQWVDYAQMEAMACHFGEIYMDAAWNGRDQRTIGNRHPSAIQGTYLCRGVQPDEETALYGGERWINITINNEEEWERFCDVMNNPDWIKDSKFATHESRYKNHDELDEQITKFTKNRDNFELFYILQESGVPAGPVLDFRDMFMDPQLNSRNFFLSMKQDAVGTYRYPGFPWIFSETSLQLKNPPCMLGEHNEYIYKEVIGLTEAEIADYTSKDAIGKLSYEWAGPTPEHLINEELSDIYVLDRKPVKVG